MLLKHSPPLRDYTVLVLAVAYRSNREQTEGERITQLQMVE